MLRGGGGRDLPRGEKPRAEPSDIPLNTGEGLRAAYYVPDDATSYSSFKEHVHQIDMLFPQWLHIYPPSATLMGGGSGSQTARVSRSSTGNTVHDPDDLNKIKNVIQATKEDTDIFPDLNNYNARTGIWDAGRSAKTACRQRKRSALCAISCMRFFTALPAYRGLSLDFENLDDSAMPAYLTFIQELYARYACHESAPLCERRLAYT